MKVRMLVAIYEDDHGWASDAEVTAELTGDRQVVAIAGWEGIGRRLVKKALNDFDTRDTEEDDAE